MTTTDKMRDAFVTYMLAEHKDDGTEIREYCYHSMFDCHQAATTNLLATLDSEEMVEKLTSTAFSAYGEHYSDFKHSAPVRHMEFAIQAAIKAIKEAI